MSVQMTDEDGLVNKVDFKIEVTSPKEKPKQETEQLAEQMLEAKLVSISNMGEVQVSFNTTIVNDQYNGSSKIPNLIFDELTPSNTQMYVNVTHERLLDAFFRVESLNFTWELVGLKPKTLNSLLFKLTWDEALQISPLTD